MKDTLYILDGYSLIYRAYFAFISRPLTDREGNNVSAVQGFFRTLLVLRKEYEATRIAVAFDPIGPTFRHERFPQYKANRDAAPEDLHSQIPLIEEILGYLGIPVIRVDGFEADDIMGSIAESCRSQGCPCRLVSSDKDLMQLVDDTVKMLRPERGGGFRELGPEEVFEDKGVHPGQIIDFLALIGDSSDNIPGVKGIGEKTAVALLAQWNDLDTLYENLTSAAQGSRLTKLKEGKENAYFSRELVTIITDLDIADRIAQIGELPIDISAVFQLFRDRDMQALVRDFEAIMGNPDSSYATEDAETSESLRCDYSSILTTEDLDRWESVIRSTGILALDTETDSLDPMRADLIGLSISVQAGEAAYLPVRRPDGPCLDVQVVVDWLNRLFSSDEIKIVGQNFKYDLKVLRRAGVGIPTAWFDTMIAAWVLDASSPVGMDALADRYLNFKTLKFKEVVPKGGTFAEVPLEEAVRYAAEDADITWRLYETLSPQLEGDSQLSDIYWNIEMPLQPILAAMEMSGISLDIFELDAYGEELAFVIDGLAKEIYRLCGREFNIASPKQLQSVLFEERGLTPGKKNKTGYSTDNTVLSELAKEDPVPEKILLYRSLSKLKSTYVDVLPQLVHPKTHRIHTTYSQTGAATGRLSSNNPNLQNIPIRDENGRRIRSAFRSSPDYLFVSADYSQIELVVLAHMSKDKALCDAVRSGVDVHARTAALLFGVDILYVTSKQRRLAKAVNFGVMYGMSAFRLSNELGIPRKEAKHFIDAYFTTYDGIREFVAEAVEEAEKEAGVRTLYGRFRPLPGINSRNRVEKSAAERAAVNSRIQGTAADIVKKAMIDVHCALVQKHPEVRMLLQVHDELLVESPQEDAENVAHLLKETMESTVELSVPLRAGVEIGSSWGHLH